MTFHIYYRHVPSGRSSGKLRPPWFSHERCLVNLLGTIAPGVATGLIRLNIVFDGSEADYAADFSARQMASEAVRGGSTDSVSVRFIQGGDQRKAWRACVQLVHQDAQQVIREGDIIYLLENDYLHRPNWYNEVQVLADSGVRWDYLSLYDHPDKYPNLCAHHDASRYARLTARLFATPTRHWRSTPSTCATYMLSRETFLRDYPLLRLGIYDFRLFRLLTKMRRRILLSPLPALATHCMSDLLAPAVDWASVAASAVPGAAANRT